MLLGAALSEDDIAEGCRLAREYRVRSVLVRPSDVDQAVRILDGSGVIVSAAVGWPDGSGSTGAKLYEGRDVLRRGAREIDWTINIGKMISRQFQYVEMELIQMAKSCAENEAQLKVHLGSEYLADDLKIIACKIAKRVEASYLGVDYSLQTIALLQPLLKDRIALKVTTNVHSIAQVLELRDAGCQRIATTETAAILEDWKTPLAQAESGYAAEG